MGLSSRKSIAADLLFQRKYEQMVIRQFKKA